MRSVNPATGEPIAEYPEHDPAEVQRRLERAAATFATWRRTSFAERSAILVSVARVLRQDRDAADGGAGVLGPLLLKAADQHWIYPRPSVQECTGSEAGNRTNVEVGSRTRRGSRKKKKSAPVAAETLFGTFCFLDAET